MNSRKKINIADSKLKVLPKTVRCQWRDILKYSKEKMLF